METQKIKHNIKHKLNQEEIKIILEYSLIEIEREATQEAQDSRQKVGQEFQAERVLKVYSDFKGDYILIRKPLFKAGSFYKIIEGNNKITLEAVKPQEIGVLK